MKTIASLTDEQLIEIARLAYGGNLLNPKVEFDKETISIHYDVENWLPGEVVIYTNLDIIVSNDDGLDRVSNQYKIFQLLNQWEIQPI